MKLRGAAKAIDVVATKWEVKCLRQRVAELVSAVSMLVEGVAAPAGDDSALLEAIAFDGSKSMKGPEERNQEHFGSLLPRSMACSPEEAARTPAVRGGPVRQPHLEVHPGDDLEDSSGPEGACTCL